jgi:hypothetical protein
VPTLIASPQVITAAGHPPKRIPLQSLTAAPDPANFSRQGSPPPNSLQASGSRRVVGTVRAVPGAPPEQRTTTCGNDTEVPVDN